MNRFALFALVLLLTACGASTPAPETAGGLATERGDVAHTDLRCLYRQNTGSDDTLELQLQFLGGPDRIAFAAYVENPETGTAALSSSGTTEMTFEVYRSSQMYRSSALGDGDVVVDLEALTPPSELSEGEELSLVGQLRVSDFALPGSESGGGSIAIRPSVIPIFCTATFETSEVLD